MKNILVIAGVVVVVVGVAWWRSGPEAAGQASTLPRLVELGAGKCVACKQMKPIIEELAREFEGKLQVENIDVEREPKRAEVFNWRLIPCQVFLAPDGRELWRNEGFLPKDEILGKWVELGYDLRGSIAGSQTQSADAPAADNGGAIAVVSQESEPAPAASGGEDASEQEASVVEEAKVVAYYLHRTMRCPTCQTIESYAEQVMRQAFAQELADGQLEIQSVDIQQSENRDLVASFGQDNQGLILVRAGGDGLVKRKNLTMVWQLVGNYEAFARYVQREVTQMLEG